MPPTVLIVAHDAGGAEILAAWCKRHGAAHRLLYRLAGPAMTVFQRELGEIASTGLDVLAGFGHHDFVLTGTSLEADLERQAIASARSLRVRVVSFLDHWDLYRERFGTEADWRAQLPDQLWVGDQYAYEFALAQGFPEERLKLVDNPYLDSIKALKTGAPAAEAGHQLLYICEPVSRKLASAFGEQAATYDDELRNMALFLAAAAEHTGTFSRITLRLHPSESADKYQSTVTPHAGKIPVFFSEAAKLVGDILNHTVVVGIESNALVIALFLDLPVFSCVTGKQYRISLPHRKIRRITDHGQLFKYLMKEKP